jgi:hypothetical protein
MPEKGFYRMTESAWYCAYAEKDSYRNDRRSNC